MQHIQTAEFSLIDQSIIDRKVDEVLRFIDDIQTHSQPIIDECLIVFSKTVLTQTTENILTTATN
jgi:hypothetical protein